MKRFLLISAVLVCLTVPAFGQAGAIGIFSTAGGYSSYFVDAGGLVQVHFIHVNHTGATASQWKLDLGGLPWTHLGDIWNTTLDIGKSITGVSLGYGACMTAPTYLGRATFFGSSAPECSWIRIVADPRAPTGGIEGVDCVLPDPNKTVPMSGAGIVNNNGHCPVAVETTTWGQVKVLYQ